MADVDKLKCPHDKKPCIKERCIGWQTGAVEKSGIDGKPQTVLHGDCYLVWNLLYLKGIANRTDGTQKAIESFRNEMVSGNQQTQFLLGRAQLNLLKGNGEKEPSLKNDRS